jgi:hypothetical protein
MVNNIQVAINWHRQFFAADDAASQQFEDTKLRKTATWVLFTTQEDTVKVHSKGTDDPEGFCAMIHKDFECEACYDIVSAGSESTDSSPMNKLCFVSWIPDDAGTKQKI